MNLAFFVKSLRLGGLRFYRLNSMNKVFTSTTSCTIIVRHSIVVLIKSEPYRRIQKLALEISLFCIQKKLLAVLVGFELSLSLSFSSIR